MDDVRVNGSGVNDPTAYSAIVRAEGTEVQSDIAEGEIWSTETSTGFEKIELIVAVNDNIASALTLVENDRTPNAINAEVDGKTLYSNAAMLHFAFATNLKKKIGEVSSQKLRRIREKIAEVLGVPNIKAEMARNDRLEAENDRLEKELAEAKNCKCTSVECKRDVKSETEARLRCEFLLEERDLTIEMLKRQISMLQERIIDGELSRL